MPFISVLCSKETPTNSWDLDGFQDEPSLVNSAVAAVMLSVFPSREASKEFVGHGHQQGPWSHKPSQRPFVVLCVGSLCLPVADRV
jgi:hypothetical protein